MLNITDFRAKYPEFSLASDDLVQVFLDDAWLEIAETVWGVRADIGHGLLTAHNLVLAPTGQFARLDSDKGDSIYGVKYREMRASVACLLRIF